jgi:hypothetical protein
MIVPASRLSFWHGAPGRPICLGSWAAKAAGGDARPTKPKAKAGN